MDAVAQGRVPHALLLVGPQGVGKTSLAIELAMLLGDPDAGPDLMGQWQADTLVNFEKGCSSTDILICTSSEGLI